MMTNNAKPVMTRRDYLLSERREQRAARQSLRETLQSLPAGVLEGIAADFDRAQSISDQMQSWLDEPMPCAPILPAALPAPRQSREAPRPFTPTPAPSASAPAVAVPEPVAAPVEAVPSLGAGGKETPVQRRERLEQRVSHWKAKGVRSFTARVAEEEGVTEVRIRQILRAKGKKPATKKPKAKPRPPATFCSGLMSSAGRAR